MKWQLCPMCEGQGIVSKPPYVAGDQREWTSSSCSHTCKMCNGQGKILEPTEDTNEQS